MCSVRTFIAMLKLGVAISWSGDQDSAIRLLRSSSYESPPPYRAPPVPNTKFHNQTHYGLVTEAMYEKFYSPCNIRHSDVSLYGLESRPPYLRYPHYYGEMVPHSTVVHFGCSNGESLSAGSPSWDLCHNGYWTKLDSGKKPKCVANGDECKVPYIPHANMKIPNIEPNGMVKHLTRINVECEQGSYPKFKNMVIVCTWRNWSHWIHGTKYSMKELSSLCSQPETHRIEQTPETESLSDFGIDNYGTDCIQLYVPGAYYKHQERKFAFTTDSSDLHRNGASISIFCFNDDKPPAVGSKFVTCIDGSWTFPEDFPNCQMDCEIPAVLIYGAVLLETSNVRWIPDTGRLGFKCAKGFRMVKNSQFDPSVICTNGQWKADPQHYGYCTEEVANRDKIRANYRRLDEFGIKRHVDELGMNQYVNDSGLGRHAAMFGAPCSLPHPQRIQIDINDSPLVEHGNFRDLKCLPKYKQLGDSRVFCYNGELFYRSKPHCMKKPMKGCSIPTIARSRLPAGQQVASGTRLKMKCVFGYYVVGSSHMFCEGGKWYPIPGKEVPRCVPVVPFCCAP